MAGLRSSPSIWSAAAFRKAAKFATAPSGWLETAQKRRLHRAARSVYGEANLAPITRERFSPAPPPTGAERRSSSGKPRCAAGPR